MKPLTIVSAGQHTRLQAVLELALTGIPYDLSVIRGWTYARPIP